MSWVGKYVEIERSDGKVFEGHVFKIHAESGESEEIFWQEVDGQNSRISMDDVREIRPLSADKIHEIQQAERDREAAPYVQHLLYEIQQMGDASALAKSGPGRAYTAAVESCLIHARLLIEFLMGRPKKNGTGRSRESSDIKPSMFIDSWDPKDRDRFDTFLTRLDRHLVHLTKERGTVAPDDGSWARVEIPKILGVMTEFGLALEKAKSQHADAVLSACSIAVSRATT